MPLNRALSRWNVYVIIEGGIFLIYYHYLCSCVCVPYVGEGSFSSPSAPAPAPAEHPIKINAINPSR